MCTIEKGPSKIICENRFFILHARGNCVRYGADQELGPNKRRAASEAARLSVKWDRSIHRWNMEILTQNGNSFYIETQLLHQDTPPQKKSEVNLILQTERGLLLGVLAAGQRVLVVSNTVLYLRPDLSSVEIWADHPLLPTMASHNREQSSWQMVRLKSQRLFPRDGCNRHLIWPSIERRWQLSCRANQRKDGLPIKR